jgi:hypothetical protein
VFADGEDDAPSELLDLILRRQYQSDAYATAANEMIEASALAERNPPGANDHIDAAEAALNETC